MPSECEVFARLGYDFGVTASACTIRRFLFGTTAAAMLLLAACGQTSGNDPSPSVSASPSTSASPSASASPAVTPSTDLSAITVSDTDVPVITLAATPWAIDSTQSKVLREGSSKQVLTETSTVTMNYVGVNGTTGEIFDSSYERGEQATFALDGVVAGFAKGLTGKSVGSRVLVAMPAADGYPSGSPDGTIAAGTSLVFVIDIISANFEEAMGEAVQPAAGLPTVTMTDGKPELAIPAGAVAPADLVIQPLIKGAGPAITATSTIEVKYRSWIFGDGQLFEDAWAAQAGALNGLITGWQEGLLGQTAGSRVMLIVPPAKAFRDGQPSASPSLAPGQTLVYVIDILNVQG